MQRLMLRVSCLRPDGLAQPRGSHVSATSSFLSSFTDLHKLDTSPSATMEETAEAWPVSSGGL